MKYQADGYPRRKAVTTIKKNAAVTETVQKRVWQLRNAFHALVAQGQNLLLKVTGLFHTARDFSVA